MLKKLLIVAGLVGAAVMVQTPAQAGKLHFEVTRYDSHVNHVHHKGTRHVKDGRFISDRKLLKERKLSKKHKHNGYRKHARLSNPEIRYLLRDRGFRRIKFHDRYRGVATVTAIGPRGHLGRFDVSTRNGRILDRKILRRAHHSGYRNHYGGFRHHDRGFRSGFVINF